MAQDSAAQPDDNYDPDLDEPNSNKGNGKGRGNGEALMRVSRITGFMAKPALFDGTGPDRFIKFEEWAVTLKAYLATVNPYYEPLMDYAETTDFVIRKDNYDPRKANCKVTIEDMHCMATDLRMTMLSYTTGNARTRLLKYQEHSKDGFELWRKVYLEYKLQDRDKTRQLLTNIYSYQFDQNHFEESLITWEALIAKYEKISNKQVDADVLISVLLNATTGALFEHLTLNTDKTTSFNQLREKVVDWYKKTQSTSGAIIAATWKGKGSWKGNYQGKGQYSQQPRKGKGKGSGWRPKGKGKGQWKAKGKGKYSHGKGKRGKSKGKRKILSKQFRERTILAKAWKRMQKR